MTVRILVHDGQPRVLVEDVGQLEEVLRTASEEAQSRGILGAILIEAEDGNEICFVIGGEETVLGFDYGHGDPPYYASKGPSDEEEPFMTCLLNFEHHTEFPRRYVIPIADGMKAIREFVQSGELPTCISWVEV